MKRLDPVPLGTIVRKIMTSDKFERPLLEHRALEIWREFTGSDVWKRTLFVRVEEGTLYARIVSAPLRHELMMHRTSLLRQINSRLDRPIIREIKII